MQGDDTRHLAAGGDDLLGVQSRARFEQDVGGLAKKLDGAGTMNAAIASATITSMPSRRRGDGGG
jgi:hypothetical protein